MKKKVILLAGPTAGGKSALALDLAQRLDGAIVNADSMQVYNTLRIMTARPEPADEARVPHHLYGYRPAQRPSSAALWAEDARAVLETLWRQGRTPVVVGGTGLYFRSLMEGIAPVPDIPDDIRTAIRERLTMFGPETLHAELATRDPAMANRLKPGDRQRIARALEVLETTGVSLLDWQARPASGGLRDIEGLHIIAMVLMPERNDLYARIDRRLVAMIENGGLDEVRALMTLGLDPGLPVMKALGVPELMACLRGNYGLETAIEQAQTATRRYAKRQTTWFRNQFSDWTIGNEKFLESFLEKNIRLLDF